jgi:CMP-N,N'-diacetyllegionaminic acid synthase
MIAIIPARGGSKGLPGKNTKLLSGLPLICYSINAALKSSLVDRVIVSTEDNEIASIAKDCGAEVPFIRPANLSSDTSLAIDTYLHAVDFIAMQDLKPIESCFAMVPTAPIKFYQDIDEAIKIFNDKNANSVISVTEAPTPLNWHKRITKNGILENFSNEFNSQKNRQEHESTYIPNGAIFVFKTEILRLTRQYYTNKTYPYFMPRERSIDIDDLFDFKLAEYLVKKN